jgi:hypothetical protein
MLDKTKKLAALTGVLVFATSLAFAADQDQDRTRLMDRDQTKNQIKDRTQDRDRIQDQTRDRIYGSQLMTRKERNEYRARMRAAKTAQERNRIREQHHERMKVRAKERGVSLPDDPPARGGGMGMGGGMGAGGGKR